MRSFVAFLKKEGLEQLRSGKLTILGILFVCFGIMNPAIAKLTPWLLETLSDSLAETGMIVTGVTVSAMDSWVQFFKNIPMALIAFVFLQSNLFTKEYQSGTLILSLTKGLKRSTVVLSKVTVLTVLWTLSFWLCFAVTYLYNAYFWDNSIAQHLLLSVGCWWLFGMLVIALMTLFSTLSDSNTGVLLGTGGVVLASYLLGLLPKVGKYLPTFLTDGNSLIYGTREPHAYLASIFITTGITLVCFAASFPLFQKKQL